MTEQGIQWAAVGVPPTGEDLEEISPDRLGASMRAGHINRRFDRDIAHLAYPRVSYGPWVTGATGDQWAVRRVWDDGHSEVEPTSSRHLAERLARHDGAYAYAEVVSRTVTFGQWWLAGAEVGA